jgi:hypothetical protein
VKDVANIRRKPLANERQGEEGEWVVEDIAHANAPHALRSFRG